MLVESALDWNSAHILELYPSWNYALDGTMPWLELCLDWNNAPDGTLPRLELYLSWNLALVGTPPLQSAWTQLDLKQRDNVAYIPVGTLLKSYLI